MEICIFVLMPNSKYRFTVLGLILSVMLAGCHVPRFFVYNFAGIKDYKKFPARDIAREGKAFVFPTPVHPKSSDQLFENTRMGRDADSFEDYISDEKTVAFLVIHHDTLVYEKYFARRDSSSVIPSFSMAKSYLSAMIGIAIAEGYISDVQQPVTTYITEWQGTAFDRITIENALRMESGIEYVENYYNPFGNVATAYYGTNLYRHLSRVTVGNAQGQFDYKSIDTQLLALVLERAVGKKPGVYLEEKIWKPMGMEYDATWSLDSRRNDTEKGFCCLNARARDFAKFGRLYLHNGNWEGKQIVPKAWVENSTQGRTGYGYQWWLGHDHFSAVGFLGQYVMVFPEQDAIIVRMGKNYGDISWRSLGRDIATSL